MSNNVIFNLDELFISVGIDVGADFSWMSIALPNQQLVGKPYKILHSSMNSLTTAVSKIKEAEEIFNSFYVKQKQSLEGRLRKPS